MSEQIWAIFLDFDGTLVDIAERPDAIVVDPGLPGLLTELRWRLGGAAAIVTGRRVSEITGFLPDLPLDICGLHGLERRIGGRVAHPAGLAELAPEIEALRVKLALFPGILIEDKQVGVAVHWRQAPEAAAEALAAITDLADRLGPAYRVQDGKAVREIVPADAGKGGAVRALMSTAPYAGRVPIFAGDDRTDEDGFAAVEELGGVAIKVGAGETLARHRAHTARDFRQWLGAFAKGRSTPADFPPA